MNLEIKTEQDLIKSLEDEIKKLQHQCNSNRGLWCIDKSPQDVTIEWIRENCFQFT